MKIAITGGIGSGKSYVCKIIEDIGFPIFYCDSEARKILLHDTQVQTALKALIGENLYDKAGNLNKSIMRDFLCKGKSYASQVDAIVHPQVGASFIKWCQQQTTSKVFMECAILFESGFDRYADCIVHVSAPEDIRIQRVVSRDHISKEKALGIISLQMSEEEKSKRADFVILNDGKCDLTKQIQQILMD